MDKAEYENLKKNIEVNSRTFQMKKLYNNFIANKKKETYDDLICFLNSFVNLNKHKYTVYLLDENSVVLYKNNGLNIYEKYLTKSNIYDITNLYNYFHSKDDSIYIEFYESIEHVDLPIGSLLKSFYTFLILSEQNVWKEPIVGYYYWQGNFVGSSPKTQYYFNTVTSTQTSYQSPSNLTTTTGQFNYYGDNLPPGLNTIILFTGYSKVNDVLNNLTNYTTRTNMYSNAKNYFQTNNVQNYLLSLCFGGGIASTGGWDTGYSGAIYSIYQACTKKGVSFSYEETGTGNVLSGVGTGTLDYSYNSFTFDLETWGSSSTSGSTGLDFINLFNYIKFNVNSNFNTWEMFIIVSIAHSCSNYNGTGQQVISQLLSDSTGSYDFISNQLYTQNVGTTIEYCANYNILWNNTGSNDNFVYYLSQNKNFIKYGVNMILPSLFNNNLLNSGGSNNSNPPNLYFYQSTSTDSNTPVPTASGWKQINYTIDNGATMFFNTLFNVSNMDLGGSLQWNNGELL
jgi:hypothetical protein